MSAAAGGGASSDDGGGGSLYARVERAGSELQRALTDSVVQRIEQTQSTKLADRLRADVLEERARVRSLTEERDALSAAAKQLLQQLARRSEETATANERWQQTLGEWADERAFLLRRVEQLAENELFGRNRALFQLLNEKEVDASRLRAQRDAAATEVSDLRHQLEELREAELEAEAGGALDSDAHRLRLAEQHVLRLKGHVARLEADCAMAGANHVRDTRAAAERHAEELARGAAERATLQRNIAELGGGARDARAEARRAAARAASAAALHAARAATRASVAALHAARRATSPSPSPSPSLSAPHLEAVSTRSLQHALAKSAAERTAASLLTVVLKSTELKSQNRSAPV